MSEPTVTPDAIVHLSSLARCPLLDSAGERLGRVDDVVAHLDAEGLPPVVGLMARIGDPIETGPSIPKEQWTMPPLNLLARPQWSTGRKVAMLTLRGYLIVSAILLIVKAVKLGGG